MLSIPLQVMTPHQRVIMAGDSRKEMEEWLSSIKQAALKADKSVSIPKYYRNKIGCHSVMSCIIL